MLISKSHKCPYREQPHENLAYAQYTSGSWCYSCNRGSFRDRSFVPHKEINIINPLEGIKLPRGATNNIKEWPIHILAWLYQYYIYNADIIKHSIMYVPYEEFTTKNGVKYYGESVIFLVVSDDNNKSIGYQRRFFPTKLFYSFGCSGVIMEYLVPSMSNTIVLVEDYISAIRVSNIENCIWLQGTSLTKKLISYIMQNYSTIKIWLDGDEPGQKAAKVAIKQLKDYGEKEAISRAFAIRESRTVHNIITDQDPKCYTNEEIRRILE